MPTYLAYQVASDGRIHHPPVEMQHPSNAEAVIEAAVWAVEPYSVEVWSEGCWVAAVPAAKLSRPVADLLAEIEKSERLRAQILSE